MDDCCQKPSSHETDRICPGCGQMGKRVQLITLKALLKPSALEIIRAEGLYAFCPNALCDVVYFSTSHIFEKRMLKVPVFQKDDGLAVPVCYCFGWTRQRLIETDLKSRRPLDEIRQHVQANRCGCEVNNPQGTCCLGNVSAFIRSLGGPIERE